MDAMNGLHARARGLMRGALRKAGAPPAKFSRATFDRRRHRGKECLGGIARVSGVPFCPAWLSRNDAVGATREVARVAPAPSRVASPAPRPGVPVERTVGWAASHRLVGRVAPGVCRRGAGNNTRGACATQAQLHRSGSGMCRGSTARTASGPLPSWSGPPPLPNQEPLRTRWSPARSRNRRRRARRCP